jgi:hypothetical protein
MCRNRDPGKARHGGRRRQNDQTMLESETPV